MAKHYYTTLRPSSRECLGSADKTVKTHTVLVFGYFYGDGTWHMTRRAGQRPSGSVPRSLPSFIQVTGIYAAFFFHGRGRVQVVFELSIPSQPDRAGGESGDKGVRSVEYGGNLNKPTK